MIVFDDIEIELGQSYFVCALKSDFLGNEEKVQSVLRKWGLEEFKQKGVFFDVGDIVAVIENKEVWPSAYRIMVKRKPSKAGEEYPQHWSDAGLFSENDITVLFCFNPYSKYGHFVLGDEHTYSAITHGVPVKDVLA